jgi:hypothetical protein
MSTVTKPADRADWLAARHPFFNASDAGCLYGVHPFRTLADVAVDKLSPDPRDDGETEAMERGTRLEPFLLDWFGDKHGCKVVTPDVLFVDGRLMATLDGEIVGSDMEWIEAKTTSQVWSAPPDHVYWQVVAQAAASGRRSCWVVWIDADMSFKQHRVVPSQEHIDDVRARSEAFMDFIALGMMPEGVEMTAEHVARLFPAPTLGTYAELDDEGLAAVVEWEQARRLRLEAVKAEATAKDAVARLIADAEAARYDGRLIATWRASKASVLPDWKALAADHPDLVASYLRPVPGPRVMRATKALGA